MGSVKLLGVAELLASGYHTLHFDLDMFIFQDPLSSMLPLSDASWDMQARLGALAGARQGPAASRERCLTTLLLCWEPLGGAMWWGVEVRLGFLVGRGCGAPPCTQVWW